MGLGISASEKTKVPIKSIANSQSSREDLLREYREYHIHPTKSYLYDNRDDPLITWKPVDYDPRFPYTDITKWCYVSFVDHYRCRKLRGDDYEPCDYFKNVFENICPTPWIEKWEEQRANKTFLANV